MVLFYIMAFETRHLGLGCNSNPLSHGNLVFFAVPYHVQLIYSTLLLSMTI